MQAELKKEIAEDPLLRAEFDALAKQTFGISFESWYRAGCWKNNYRPYTLFSGGKAVSNVSVSPMRFRLDKTARSAVQLGTVMTDPTYRKNGLAAFLMQTVLLENRADCDWLFLFANSSVLEFYPRFGFERTREYRCVKPVAGGFGSARRLSLSDPEEFALLKEHAARSNPFAVLRMEQNWELIQFYTSSVLRDGVFFVPEQDAVVLAEQDGETMICYDIFCSEEKDPEQILRATALPGTRRIELGWFPADTAGCRVEKLENDDDALFWLKGKENPFAGRPLRFPLLAHT